MKTWLILSRFAVSNKCNPELYRLIYMLVGTAFCVLRDGISYYIALRYRIIYNKVKGGNYG